MPDQELFDLAAARQLSRPAVLAAQVERMLQDDRGWRFYQQFTDQWLKLENTAQIAIDTGTYKGFQTDLKEEMLQETRHFLRHLILNNLSGLNLLDADFTMLNERLARHYGVEGVVGNTYRQVALTDETRGGLLGRVSRVEEQYIEVEIADKTEVKLQKAAVAAMLPKGTIKQI